MAARVFELKHGGEELNKVLALVQTASRNSPEKEALLATLAIEIYVDPTIASSEQALAKTRSVCLQSVRSC